MFPNVGTTFAIAVRFGSHPGESLVEGDHVIHEFVTRPEGGRTATEHTVTFGLEGLRVGGGTTGTDILRNHHAEASVKPAVNTTVKAAFVDLIPRSRSVGFVQAIDPIASVDDSARRAIVSRLLVERRSARMNHAGRHR